jgi:fused signal recognition particle receptor
MSEGSLFGVALLSVVSLGTIAQFIAALRTPVPRAPEEKAPEKKGVAKKEVEAAPVQKVEIAWSQRLRNGLSKTRQSVWGKIEAVMSGRTLTDEQIEEIEELLYSSDMGSKTIQEIIEGLESHRGEEFGSDGLKNYLFSTLREKLAPIQNQLSEDLFQFQGKGSGPKVVMIVGVNGAGKTTTIGKLATKLTRQGANVYVGACDTFRAAAVDQLQVWCDRAGATMVRAKEGGDPSGVAYEALERAINDQADYCLIDTAGRLHTKTNLMEELAKNKRVLSKLDPTAPHQTLLVIDAVTGQNALRQAEEFNKALELTGLIFTKCDGSSKAGNAVSIVQTLNVPISYIGVGEGVDDLNPFVVDEYLSALLDYRQTGESSLTS